ncbi:MAG: VWA-like domain-containing protein, partial [Pseudomonadota bacterium]
KEDQSDGGRAEQPSRPDNQDRGGKGQGNSAGNDRPPADDRTQGSGRQESTEQDDGGRGGRAARKDEGGSGEAERDSGEPSRDPPEPLTPDERETLSVQWQQRLAGAAQQALQAGKLGGSMARLVEHLLQPQVPWRTLLARFLSSLARDDFSYMRPSRREGDAIHPSLRSAQVDLVVAMDTSGSIKADEMDEFISEINAIKGQIRARITLLPCDSCLVEGAPWLFEPWEDFTRPERIQGGGGTDFRPVFEWIRQQGMCPELLIYFTDAEGSFPPQPPEYPVLWLVKGRQRIPWGERIQLN